MSDGSEDSLDRLRESRELDFEAFDERVREEGEVIKEALAAGTFDNAGLAIGLEVEFYAADRDGHWIRRIPRELLDSIGFDRELGLHNAELNASVQPYNEPGLDALLKEIEAKTAALQGRAAAGGLRLVSDGMWTIGPEDGTTRQYLTEATEGEGLTLGINVSNAVRYHGFASSRRKLVGEIEVPGVGFEAASPGPVSLTTSIQPHYQFRRAADLPDRLAAAIRLAGPVLALGVNSPFLPPELYDDLSPEILLSAGYVENRVPIYEGMMNPVEGPPKVRFPRDVETPAEAVDRVVEDTTIIPAEIEAGERFDDAFVHFRHAHGSYWRWVRPVFDGATEAAANVRIEFRPLPAQPTLPDTAAFVAAFAGAMTAIADRDHPIGELPWERARENFYAAARDGLDAELTWITADGERTDDADRLYADLFELAVDGLQSAGVSAERATGWIDPLRDRVDRRRTPASWKRAVAAEALAAGASPAEAIRESQRAYVDRQVESLYDGSFADWPDP